MLQVQVPHVNIPDDLVQTFDQQNIKAVLLAISSAYNIL